MNSTPRPLRVVPDTTNGLSITFHLTSGANRPDEVIENLIRRAATEVCEAQASSHHLHPIWVIRPGERTITLELGKETTGSERIVQEICWAIDELLVQASVGLITRVT